MKNPLRRTRGLLALVAMSQLSTLAARADGPVAPPLLQFASGLPGKQVSLSWASEAGVRYRIEKSGSLDGGWKQVALVETPGTDGAWLDPEPTTQKAFYRVMQPQAEVFSISPALLQPLGGGILIHGQYLPAGSVLVLDPGDGTSLSALLEALGGGVWRASFVGATLPGGAIISARIEDGNGGTLVVLNQTITVTDTGRALDGPPSSPPAMASIEGARNNFQLGSLAVEDSLVERAAGSGRSNLMFGHVGRPAARVASGGPDEDCDDSDPFTPLGMAINEKGLPGDKKPRPWGPTNPKPKGRTASGGGDGDCDDSDCDAGPDSMPGYASKKGYDYYQMAGDKVVSKRIAPSPSGIPGEVSFETCDLALPCPAGPPLAWICTYRSMKPVTSGHGPGWDFSYNIFIEPVTGSDGVTISSVIVHDGGGRADTFHLQGDGTYTCDGMFRTGALSGDTFTLTFADKATWTFNPLDGSPPAGKIAAITDRNGVSLTCDYDAATGLLSTVNDAFDRSIAVEWDTGSPPRIASVSAGKGGAVHIKTSYGYSGTDRLRTATSPPFAPGSQPVAGDTTFAYASGSPDPRLNDNLLSVTDGAGRLLEAFAYSAETDPLHLDYDTCVSHNRNKTGHVTLMKREAMPPGGPVPGGYTVFEVDELGRLTETDCDSHHRVVALREYTGFCVPDTPVTSTTNRPTGKLRAADPDCFETTCTYNSDSLCTRITCPDGSQERVVYDRDFRRSCPVRERGNPRLITLRTPAGEERTVSCDYLPDHGNPESARPGNPIGGLSVKGGHNPKPHSLVWSPRSNYLDDDDDGDAIPTSDERKGWDGTIKGLVAKEEGGRHTPFHNKYRPMARVAGGGVDDDCDGMADETQLAGRKQKAWLCCNFRLRMVSAYGQVSTWAYDEHGNCAGYVSPLPNRGNLYQYNTRGQCVSVTSLNGAASSFHDAFNYGADGFLSSIVRDDNGLQLTTTLERDPQGRVNRVIDPRGNDWLFTHNPLDQCVQVQSPAMPNRISMNVTIDAGGRVARCDFDHLGPDGTPVTANPAYSTFHVYDDRARLVRVAEEERPVVGSATLDPATLGIENFAVCDITYDDAGQCVRLSTPAACRAQSTDRDCDFQYDERGMLHRRIDGGTGNAAAVTTEYDYDVYGALVRCATIDSGGTSPESHFEYDGFHRPASTTDPMGNVATFEYGNDGSVTTSVYGEVNDVPGSAGNTLLSRSVLKEYFQSGDKPTQDQFGTLIDSRGRPSINTPFFRVETKDDTLTEERFSPGETGPHATEVTVVDRSPAGLVKSVTRNGDALLSCSYDTAARLAFATTGSCATTFTRDANGNILVCGETEHFSVGGLPPKTFSATRVFDALGRVTQVTDGIGNSASFSYDSLGRRVSMTEAGGRVVRAEYDGDSPTTGPFSRLVAADLDADGLDDLVCATLVRSGECHSLTDANGFTTSYTRDALGRAVRCDHPDGTSEEWGFDALGRNTSRTFQDASVCTASHDLNGRVTACAWSNVPAGVAAVADAFYQHDGLGRCVSATRGGSVVSFAYDSIGNPSGESQNGQTITRTFNHRGRTSITYPDGRVFSETRDGLGRLLAVFKVMGGHPVSPPVVTMDYLGMRVSQSSQANGVVTDYLYRADGDDPPPGGPDSSFAACVRVTVRDALSNVLADTVLRRDANQRVTREETAFSAVADAPGRTKSLTRDAAGRVTACVISRRETAGGPEIPESGVSYVLGKEGGRISELRNSIAGGYTRDATLPPGDLQMGQYTTWPGNPDPLEWDENGNLGLLPTPTTKIAFAHDVEGRVTTVSDVSDPANPVTLVSYDHDAIGRCVSRSSGGSDGLPPETTGFVYDGSVCIQELGDDGTGVVNAAVTLVCGDGIRHCISTRNGTLYYPNGGDSYVGTCDASLSYVGPCDASDSYVGPCDASDSYVGPCDADMVITDATGNPVERLAYDDAGKPVFLNSDGTPSSTGHAVSPIRWMAPESMWEPDFRMHVGSGGGIYSPDLGMVVSGGKNKPRDKYVKTGHVTLMK